MKIGTLTFHRAINFGALLQTYALQKVLENMGMYSEVIDYRCENIEKGYESLRGQDILKFKKVLLVIYKIAYGKYEINNRYNFEQFTRNNIKLTKIQYNCIADLKNIEKEYDKVIVGSDQVWNFSLSNFDKVYFLDFIDDNNKKNAYAASFGLKNISNDYLKEYKRLLGDFNFISVRENEGQTIIKNIINRYAPKVLDPTLLLSKDEWLNVSEKQNNNDTKYLLLYLLLDDKEAIDYARKYAKNNELQIIYINKKLIPKFGMKNESKISIERWICLFANAEYIITNSFHGVCFSIIFNKQFKVSIHSQLEKVSSRIISLLSDLGLMDCLVQDYKKHIEVENIDYKIVERRLSIEKEKSMNYIKRDILDMSGKAI